MIVNLTRDGWEVIYHRAHALLAAQLAGQWRKADAPEQLYETIAAIAHHDDLEREWEGDELTPVGAPLDFTLAQGGDSVEPLRQHILEARYRGRWVTLLTSKHVCFLNQTKWGENQEWDDFLNEQVELQERYRKELGITKKQSERAYQFMRWCDRLSLILTQRQIPDAGRAVEITSDLDGQRYELRQVEDDKVTVEPWPFEEDEFIVNVESACLTKLQFKNHEELVAALDSAPIKQVDWTFSKAKSSPKKSE